MGETNGYLSLGDSTWDVMAALPILDNLGASHTIDWGKIGLSSKLRFACGSPEFLNKLRPLLERIPLPVKSPELWNKAAEGAIPLSPNPDGRGEGGCCDHNSAIRG